MGLIPKGVCKMGLVPKGACQVGVGLYHKGVSNGKGVCEVDVEILSRDMLYHQFSLLKQ